jgi:hypothetical protein
MTTNIEAYTLINGKTERALLTEAFEQLKARGTKAAFGRSLQSGKGDRVWCDGQDVHTAFGDSYQGGWYTSDHLVYNLTITLGGEMNRASVIEFFKGFGLDAEAHNHWGENVVIHPHMSPQVRQDLAQWAEAVTLIETLKEAERNLVDNARFLADPVLVASMDPKELTATARRISDLGSTIWYTRQHVERQYINIWTEGTWEATKIDAQKLATMTAEEVMALRIQA